MEEKQINDLRFIVVFANSMIMVIMAMNQYADKLGHCIYFGENKILDSEGNSIIDKDHPFIAVFDIAAINVSTMEDSILLDDFDSGLNNSKIVMSA